MSIESFAVRSVSPYRLSGPDSGREYEHVEAVATVALDPAHPANAFVVDLDRARRDPDGLVRLEADVVLIRPAEAGPAPCCSWSPTGAW